MKENNSIKLTLEIPGLLNALNNLADALRGNSVAVPTGSAPEAVKATQPEAVADTPQTHINDIQPAQQNTAAVTPATAVTPSEAAANYTIDQLSIAGAALCEQGKMAQLIALLGKYGVQAVTQLKPTPDVLNPFADELKALGANL